MHGLKRLFLTLFALMLAVGTTYAQPGRGFNQTEITALYNPATESTVSGKIKQVTVAETGYGRFPGVIVDLAVKDETMKVYVAPVWYLTRIKAELLEQQSVTVQGSRVTHRGRPLLIARSLIHKGEEITLRDASGTPEWAGRRMGPGPGRGMGRRNR